MDDVPSSDRNVEAQKKAAGDFPVTTGASAIFDCIVQFTSKLRNICHNRFTRAARTSAALPQDVRRGLLSIDGWASRSCLESRKTRPQYMAAGAKWLAENDFARVGHRRADFLQRRVAVPELVRRKINEPGVDQLIPGVEPARANKGSGVEDAENGGGRYQQLFAREGFTIDESERSSQALHDCAPGDPFPWSDVTDKTTIQRHGCAFTLCFLEHGKTENGVQKAEHRAAMQKSVGIGVAAVTLKPVLGDAALIAAPVVGAVVVDEPFGGGRERLEALRRRRCHQENSSLGIMIFGWRGGITAHSRRRLDAQPDACRQRVSFRQVQISRR